MTCWPVDKDGLTLNTCETSLCLYCSFPVEIFSFPDRRFREQSQDPPHIPTKWIVPVRSRETCPMNKFSLLLHSLWFAVLFNLHAHWGGNGFWQCPCPHDAQEEGLTTTHITGIECASCSSVGQGQKRLLLLKVATASHFLRWILSYMFIICVCCVKFIPLMNVESSKSSVPVPVMRLWWMWTSFTSVYKSS